MPIVYKKKEENLGSFDRAMKVFRTTYVCMYINIYNMYVISKLCHNGLPDIESNMGYK